MIILYTISFYVLSSNYADYMELGPFYNCLCIKFLDQSGNIVSDSWDPCQISLKKKKEVALYTGPSNVCMCKFLSSSNEKIKLSWHGTLTGHLR